MQDQRQSLSQITINQLTDSNLYGVGVEPEYVEYRKFEKFKGKLFIHFAKLNLSSFPVRYSLNVIAISVLTIVYRAYQAHHIVQCQIRSSLGQWCAI